MSNTHAHFSGNSRLSHLNISVRVTIADAPTPTTILWPRGVVDTTGPGRYGSNANKTTIIRKSTPTTRHTDINKKKPSQCFAGARTCTTNTGHTFILVRYASQRIDRLINLRQSRQENAEIFVGVVFYCLHVPATYRLVRARARNDPPN